MNIRFEATSENYGFDSTATPDWIMIPVGAEKTVWLADGAGLTVASASPGIATVSDNNEPDPTRPNRRMLRISGRMPGRTFIEVRQGKQVLKRLEAAVKPLITLKLSFHFVSDNANHGTNRKPEELPDILSNLNKIFTPQTNITFQKKNHFYLKFNKNLGDAVNYNVDNQGGTYMKGHEFDIVTSKRDTTAHINIFLVWRNEFVTKTVTGKIEKSEALGYSAGGRDCLIEDWNGAMDRDNDGKQDNDPIWENARMFAHELGHILGIDDVNKTRKVRNPITNHINITAVNANYVMGSGPFIPKQHASIMTAIAKQIAGK